MPNDHTFALFLAATFAVLIVPGPSVVYVVARSLEQGRMAGIVSMLGLETGMLVHVLASATGVAALVASSDLAFTTLKLSGAGYLVLLGIRQFRTLPAPGVAGRMVPDTTAGTSGDVRGDGASYARLFTDGFLVDLLNPKTTLFFLAFLPQFVDPALGPASVQLLVLGLCVLPMAVVCDGAYALLAGGLGGRRDLGRVTGVVYLGLAGATVVV